MDPLGLIGGLVSAGINLFQGNENREATERNNALQLAAYRDNMALQREMAEKNIAYQREFATQGVKWRVGDANDAGIHPLAALGAQLTSFSPVSVGSTSLNTQPATTDYGSMGQDLSRAIKATSNQDERDVAVADAIGKTAASLNLQKMSLENELLKTSIAKERAQIGPPFPGNWMDFAAGSRAPQRTPEGNALEEDPMKQKKEAVSDVGSYKLGGFTLYPNPWQSPAQALENQGGEGIGDFLGWTNVPLDIAHTIGKTDAWRAWSDFVNKRYYEPVQNPFDSRVVSSPYKKFKYNARYYGGPRSRAWGE